LTETPKKPVAKRFAAAARRLNRHPRLVGSARQAREQAMGDDEFVDMLSTARGRPADLAARQLVAARAAEPGVLGELGLTALQAWQRLSERQDRGRGKVDVAILFTDLVGFSSWALEAGDRQAVRLLREFSEATEPAVLAQRGEVVKRLGDGLMGAFWDAGSAVDAAFGAHEQTALIEVGGYRPQLRPASTSVARASSAATTSASTSTSPPGWQRRRSPVRSSSPSPPWLRSTPTLS
jgi:adenylate cyclase